MRELSAEYEARHARLMAQALKAKRQGDEEGVKVLEAEVRRLVAWQKIRMGEILEMERKVGGRCAGFWEGGEGGVDE